MNLDVKEILLQQAEAMPVLEIIAVLAGVWSVWLAKKESILVFPVGIVSVSIFIFIFLEVKLYADAGLNFYYLIASIYGWYFWKHGGKKQKAESAERPIDTVFENSDENILKEEAEISYQNFSQNLLYLFYTALVWVVLAFVLSSLTDSDVAWWDAFINALSVMAMLLMARKKIENWIFWIVADAAAIPLCIYKELYFTAFQFAIFTIIAIAGFLAWYAKLQRKYETEKET